MQDIDALVRLATRNDARPDEDWRFAGQKLGVNLTEGLPNLGLQDLRRLRSDKVVPRSVWQRDWPVQSWLSKTHGEARLMKRWGRTNPRWHSGYEVRQGAVIGRDANPTGHERGPGPAR